MPSTDWQTQAIADATLVAAPDGSAVRILCASLRGSMISFSLEPGQVSRPSLTTPVGTAFLFRDDGDGALQIVAATMPPWSGEDEALQAEGARSHKL